MNLFLTFMFIFYIGCTCGWIMELFFRRAVSGKWVNPGFLVGPYLPIYGFGLAALTAIYLMFHNLNVHPIIVILLMGATMTLIELIGGLSFVDGKGPKLWDYSNEWGNYKGIICPLFSAIWTGIAALYYFFLAQPILNGLKWFSNNLAFSFKLEELKVSIREHQEKAKEKYSFILPFNQNISLKEHLEKYKKQVSAREKKSLKLFKKQEKKKTKNKR